MVSYPGLRGIFPLIQGEQVSDGDGGRAPIGPLEALEGVDHDVPCARDVEERQQESETQLPRAKLSDHFGHDVVLLLLLGGLFFRPLRVGRHCAQQGNALCKSQFVPITHTLSSHRYQAAHSLPQRGPRIQRATKNFD
jgi:hypothetical protein